MTAPSPSRTSLHLAWPPHEILRDDSLPGADARVYFFGFDRRWYVSFIIKDGKTKTDDVLIAEGSPLARQLLIETYAEEIRCGE